MKALYLAGIAFGLFGTLASTTVNAYSVEYTYTSEKLSWDATYWNWQESDEERHYDEEQLPAFGFSFSVAANLFTPDMPLTISLDNADVWIDPDFVGFHGENLQSTTSGKVFLNPDGSIASWRVLLRLSEIITPENSAWAKLTDYKINISSAGGEDTCNCDIFKNIYNLTTQRRDFYIIAAHAQHNFSTHSDIDNWSINKTSVPDPQSWSLMLAGLFSIYALRLRRKSSKRPARLLLKNELATIT